MTKQDTKDALMDAAEDAVRMSGHDGFSYADLSKEIGIRKASIHYHFPTKADLLTAIMKRYREGMTAQLDQIDETHTVAAEKLGAYLEIYRDALQACTRLCLCVAFSAGQESLTPETHTEIDTFRVDVTQWLVAAFELGKGDGSVSAVGVPKEEAAMLFALTEGAQLGARYSGEMQDFDRALAIFLRRLA